MMENEKTKCTICGEEINVKDKLCPHCDSTVEVKSEESKGDNLEPAAETAVVESSKNPDDKIELWNPNAAANWSFLFTMVFGTFLHAKNWKALNKEEEAKISMYWFYGGIVVVILLNVLPESNFDYIVALAPLLAWYFMQAKKQVKYIKDNNIDYKRKGWGKPILVGICAFVVLSIAYIVFTGNSELEDAAQPLVSKIIADNFGRGSAKCVDVEITDELSSGLYKARAYLDNGKSVIIMIQERDNNQIYVSIPTDQ
tara:strand:- start:1370 stop:2137 length:768 start_codon:yes stop_codon:yes gene_type:complete